MSQPLVSIVVPVYNGEQYLEKTIQSILAQTFQNFELLLINDGSSDNSKQLIDQISESDSRVKAIHGPNGGVAAARNIGLEHSIGEFIAFCDQDDLWLISKLEKQIPLFENPQTGLVYCGAKAHYALYDKLTEPGFEKKMRGSVFDTLIRENMLTCCTAVIRRSALATIGGFDPDRALMGVDDWHLWLKIALVSEFDFVAENLAIHVFHGDNYSLNDEKMHEAELVCLEKMEVISQQFGKSANWSRIKQQLHSRYASSYIFSGLFDLAGETYLRANSSLPSSSLKTKAWLLKLVPNFVWSTLQTTKRKMK